MVGFNERFTMYARAHGRTEEEMIAHDTKIHPGGAMCGFILWIQQKLLDFKKENPHAFGGDRLMDQNGFTKFLAKISKVEQKLD